MAKKSYKDLHSEYEDDDGLPTWFNLCYEDEEGHNMQQSIKLQPYEEDKFYDLDGHPWGTLKNGYSQDKCAK